jgi:hypothetical protein
VGIGDDNPTANLQVKSTNAGGATQIILENLGESNASTTCSLKAIQGNRPGGEIIFGRENASDWSSGGAYANSFMSFSTVRNEGVSEQMRINSSGYVGIGETDPEQNLHIKRASGSDTAGQGHIILDVADDAGPAYALRIGDTGDDGDFHIDRRVGATWSTAISVDRATGNVGIGHTTPQFGLTLAQGTGVANKIGWEDSGNSKRASIMCSSSTDALQFHTGTSDTERMRIASDGKVGIGPSSTVSNAKGGEKLIVDGPTSHASGRWVNGWYEGSPSAANTYAHIKTSLWGGGSLHGNSQYIMGGFHIKGYQYGSGNINAVHQFHNWSGALHAYSVLDNGNHTGQTHAYVGSDGYVYLRLTTNTYRMFIVDTVQYSQYSIRDWTVTSVTGSNSTTL